MKAVSLYDALADRAGAEPAPRAAPAQAAMVGDAARRAGATAQVLFSMERHDASGLKQLWTDLEARANISFFLSWFWIGTWVEQAGLPDFVLVGRARGEVVCLGLLRKSVQWRHRAVRSRTLCLHQTGNPDEDVIHIEYNGFLCDRRFTGVEAKALAFLRRNPRIGRFDELQISGVDEAFYEQARSLGCNIQLVSRKSTAFVDLGAIRASGGDYLATISPNTRYQIKRAVRIYEGRGALSVQPARSVGEALEFLDELGNLHEEAWRKRGPGGAWRHPFLVTFHKSLIEKAFPAGGIDIVKVSCGDKPIGYVYCLVRDGWIGSYLSGFAYEEDNKVKPGLVSFYLYIRHKLGTAGQTFDFLAGDHRYKTSLGQPAPDMYWFRLQERRPQLMIEQGLRYAKQRIAGLRQKMPGGASERVRSSG